MHPPREMLSSFTSTCTAQQRSTILLTAAPPSPPASCGLDDGDKNHISLSSFYSYSNVYSPLPRHENLLFFRSLMYSQVGCLFPAPSPSEEMLGLQTAHSFHHFVVTWSGLLPNKDYYLLWQLCAQQFPGNATELTVGRCLCVIIILNWGENIRVQINMLLHWRQQ